MTNTSSTVMKSLFLFLMISLAVFGEAPQQWAGAGVGFNPYAAPQVNGLVVYAKRVLGEAHPTYSFSAVNILSIQKTPFRAMTTTETGLAQHLTKFGPFDVYGIGTAGLATSGGPDGTNAGMTFSGNVLAQAGVGKGVTIGPMFRVIKTAISDKQYAIWCVIGWGQ